MGGSYDCGRQRRRWLCEPSREVTARARLEREYRNSPADPFEPGHEPRRSAESSSRHVNHLRPGPLENLRSAEPIGDARAVFRLRVTAREVVPKRAVDYSFCVSYSGCSLVRIDVRRGRDQKKKKKKKKKYPAFIPLLKKKKKKKK